MTSASELFYNRRSRNARNATDLGIGYTLERNLHHPHPNRRHSHHRGDDCDPLRRSPHSHARHLFLRGFQTEREPVRVDHGGHHSGTGNIFGTETSSRTDRLRFSSNDRLPGDVLQARERLLERLRGVSLSGSRQRSRGASTSISWDEFASSDELRFVNATGDWVAEILREWLPGGASFIEDTAEIDLYSSTSTQGWNQKKPPGLSWEEVNRLHHEVFSNREECDREAIHRGTHECSICLERFQEGNQLICLPCDHRFHSACLGPWVQICGDCPYCRRAVVVDYHKMRNKKPSNPR